MIPDTFHFVIPLITCGKHQRIAPMKKTNVLENIEQLKEFDLNLLVVFETVYIYKSGIKSATVLGVSPSAISQSLQKLRNYFSDPLFVRDGKEVVPTSVAINLHEQISLGFGKIVNTLSEFSGQDNARKFIIYSSPYAATRILPDMVNIIQDKQLNFEFTHISADDMIESTDDLLTYRKADIVFDINPHYSFSTVTQPYMQDYVAAICRKGHPRLTDVLTPEAAQKEKSTFLTVDSDMLHLTQTQINKHYGERKFLFNSSSVMATMAMVEKTDCIGYVPYWFAEKVAASFDVRILHSTMDTEPVVTYMTYNKSSMRNDNFNTLIHALEQAKNIVNKEVN